MLVDFQQALADLTASPEFCIAARQDPSVLNDRYVLSEREWRRLTGIVRDKGMECACIVYRANRLAPLALNIPRTCKALGQDLRAVVSEFWKEFPETNVHFFVETERFCRFLQSKISEGGQFPAELPRILDEEYFIVRSALAESYTEGR